MDNMPDHFDWLAFINAVIPVAAGSKSRNVTVPDATKAFSDLALDSLDVLILCLYCYEIFDVAEESRNLPPPKNLMELSHAIEQCAQRRFADHTQALRFMDGGSNVDEC